MTLKQMAILAFLSVASIICDYIAIVSYSQMQKIANMNMQQLEFRLPAYLILKLTLTPLFTHGFSRLFLNRYWVGSTVKYFLLQCLGLFIYEFTVWDRNSSSVSYKHSASIAGGFRLIIPNIYSFNTNETLEAEPFIFQWIPHFLILFSSIFNGLIPVLSKSFMIKHSH
jgi:hypothetical protein